MMEDCAPECSLTVAALYCGLQNIIVKSFKERSDPFKTMCLLTLHYYYCLGDKINVRCLFKSLELSIKLKYVTRAALFVLQT